MPMKIQRQYEIKGFETIEGKELLHVVGSVETMDRDGDVLILKGGNLKEFQKNPLVFWMHVSRELPIGKAPIVEIRGKELHFWIEFKTGKEHIDEIKEYIQEGFLNAVSIGFIVHEAKKRTPTPEEREKGFNQVREITKWELLEISIVTIQSNYGGLIKAFGLEEDYTEIKNQVNELTKKLESIMTEEKTPGVEEKAGAVLSKATLNDVKAIKDACDRILERGGKTDDEPTKEVNIEEAVEKALLKYFADKEKPEANEVKEYDFKEYEKSIN